MDVAAWLQGLGLERYAPAFRDNDIDAEVLMRLTAEDLRELGVASIGHRRRLLDAIAALTEEATTVPAAAVKEISPDALAPADAERRQLTVMFCDLVSSTALVASRSRRSARGHRRLSPRRRRCRQELRWVCREIHGRRRLDLFRLPARA
jgi:hypothetical protein